MIVVLIVIAVAFEILIFHSPIGEYPRLEKGIQSTGIFVALLAAVIALSASDPKRKKVNVVTATPFIEEEIAHDFEKMTDELKKWYKYFPHSIKSYQVHFKITNNSEFTLTRPAITFRIPDDRKHPNKHETEELWNWRGFNSNLYNSRQNLRIMEFADTSILSNSNLPYWNSKEDITIWIRMVIDDGKRNPFRVIVSVNCENADGITQIIKINPKELLKSIGKANST
jgi:hypothetical protein